MGFWHGVWVMVKKDIAMELRGKEIFTTNFMFALLIVVIFNFAFDFGTVNVKDTASGVLWVAFLFSGALSMNRSFLYEKEDDCISALMLAPLDRSSIYFGKTIVNLALTLLVMAFIIPIFTVLYNINIMENFVWQTATLFLGALGFKQLAR